MIVSKDLILDTNNLENVILLNQGLTDAQLHALYRKAALLFLPLLDGAANNAILEAMAHGLPIVTTDLPSTRFYTQEKAVFVNPSPTDYSIAVTGLLKQISEPGNQSKIAVNLRRRAQELTWDKIALEMHNMLYSPLIKRQGRSA